MKVKQSICELAKLIIRSVFGNAISKWKLIGKCSCHGCQEIFSPSSTSKDDLISHKVQLYA